MKPSRLSFRLAAKRIAGPATTAIWLAQRSAPPAPAWVKHAVLARYAYRDATWVETGTYLGETTSWLARNYPAVLSIEPSDEFASFASSRLSNRRNVKILRGPSEEMLETALRELARHDSVNFFLDGHFSGGDTYCGPNLSPIEAELGFIQRYLQTARKLAVFVDDFRLFGSQKYTSEGYPDRNALISWANRNSLEWHVEHDIFIARSDLTA